MTLLKGIDFNMYNINDNGQREILCYANDCNIEINVDTAEIMGNTSFWKDYVAVKAGYTISAPYLCIWDEGAFNYLKMFTMLKQGKRISWEASSWKEGGIIFSGDIMLVRLGFTSPDNNLIRIESSFVGLGEPLQRKEPIMQQVYLSDFNNNMLAGCPDPYPLSIFWFDHTLIGFATTPAEVISTFNYYSNTQKGGVYTLTSSVDGGCNFNMAIDISAPQPYPTTVYGRQGARFAMSPMQMNNDALSPDQTNNFVISPLA